MSVKAFASTGDTEDKPVRFEEIGPGLFAYTAGGDPNTGIIIGDDACAVVDAQATPDMARDVVARVREVTDKPIRYVILTHYHAVRVLGASGFPGALTIASAETRRLIVERGQQDWESEFGRFPRLFRGAAGIPGLTWPDITFPERMSLHLGGREIQLMHLGAGHTSGDIVAVVPDAKVAFTGDLVEFHSACYCGDALLAAWPATLERIAGLGARAVVPGRGDALKSAEAVAAALSSTRDFVTTLFATAQRAVASGATLKDSMAMTRAAMDARFGSFAIYEHCLPFNVARAYDEARGITTPVIWTAERDREMWAALQG